MSTVFRCNRCGTIYEENDNYFGGAEDINCLVEAHHKKDGDFRFYDTIDLCPECLRFYDKWKDYVRLNYGNKDNQSFFVELYKRQFKDFIKFLLSDKDFNINECSDSLFLKKWKDFKKSFVYPYDYNGE